MTKLAFRNTLIAATIILAGGVAGATHPVDYVNPYMGNISHLLKPTYPTIHRPNSMLRVYPRRGDHTEDFIHGLPVMVVNHRENTVFDLSATHKPVRELRQVVRTDWDNERITPYSYTTSIDNHRVDVSFSPAERSAMYSLDFLDKSDGHIILNARSGEISVSGNTITGWQQTWGNVRIYICMVADKAPIASGIILNGDRADMSVKSGRGDDACAVMSFSGRSTVNVKYGVSLISPDQARRNLEREIPHFDIDRLIREGRDIWNEALGRINVKGGDKNDMAVFYTSLYRCYERPVNISEDGRYFSASDHKVHDDMGRPFYTDDWLWDTYRATHPLRTLIDTSTEEDIINSFVLAADQSHDHWFPTFPSITGDSRRMNCNHGVAVVADAAAKGLENFDLEKAYEQCRGAIEDKTLAPWSASRAGWLNEFYSANGYIPALAPGEHETQPDVNDWEKRQPVPVTLGTAYDQWCLSIIAEKLGHDSDARKFMKASYNYRNLFNHETSFFHPKDKDGNFIPDFDYRFSGGPGAREFYAENNGWTYRWDVQHNIPDLISLMGGNEKFIANLDQTFNEWLGRSKYEFYAQLPDQTGNVGQFSMANEPSLHIPYLYNYAGAPWKTQKRIRDLIRQWFRNDLMGVPGDEDGGGMSAFVVLSMAGFYPVTPGKPVYTIGSPFFKETTITLSNGKKFRIVAKGCDTDKKYITSMTLNGKRLDTPWFNHSDIADGGTLVLEMNDRPGRQPITK